MAKDIFEFLRLSKTPFYLEARPELASAYAQAMKSMMEEPTLAKLLEKRGLTAQAAGIFDAPTDLEGITKRRGVEEKQVAEGKDLAGILESIFAGVVDPSEVTRLFSPESKPGVARSLQRRAGAGAADFLAQYGVGEGGDRSALESDAKNMWILGKFDPLRVGTQLLSNFAPFLLGTGAAASGAKAIGLRGGVGQTLAYALGGGGVNAVEQGGRAVLQGDKFDPGRVLIETGIFAAGGAPVGRISAGVLTGAAAVSLPPLLGREVDWTRAGAETLFGVIVGNPKLREARARVTSKDLGDQQKKVLVDTAIDAHMPKVKQELNARAEGMDYLIKQDEAVLQNMIERGGQEGIIARDALAAKRGKVVPPDAPKKNLAASPEKAQIMADMKSMTEAELTQVRDQSKGEMRTILNNALTAKKNKGAIDERIFKGTTMDVAPGKDLGVQPPDPATKADLQVEMDRGAGVVRDDVNSIVLKHLQPEWESEIEEMLVKIAVLESRPNPDIAVITKMKAHVDELKSKADEMLKSKLPFILDDVHQARRVMDGITSDMAIGEMRQLSKDLPPQFAPFEMEVRKILGEKIKGVRETDPLQAQMDDIMRQLEGSGAIVKTGPEIRPIDVPERASLLRTPQDRRLALSLQGVRRSAAKWNAKVVPVEEGGKMAGYSVMHEGDEMVFNSLKDVDKFLKALDDGNVQTLDGLRMLAERKGVAVRHVGNGEYMATNMVTGEQTLHKDLAMAKQAVDAQPDLPPTEIAPSEFSVPGAGGIPPSGSRARPPMDFVHLESMPSDFHQSVGTMKQLLLSMQDAVKLPVYDNVWRPVMDGMTRKNIFQKPFITKLRNVFRGVRPGRWGAINDALLAGENLAQVSKDLDLRRGELRAVRELERWYKELLDLDDAGMKQFLHEAVPQMRKANGDPTRISGDWSFPASTREVLDEVFDGRVRLDDGNALSMAQDILMSVGRARYMKDALSKAHRVTSSMDRMIGKARELGEGDAKKLTAFSQARALAGYFIDAASNNTTPAAKKLADTMNGHIDLLKKLRLVKGTEVTPQQVEAISMGLTSYLSGVAMSARLALATRNLFQSFLSAPKIGFDNVLAAWGESITPAGRAKVRSALIKENPRMFALDELTSAYPTLKGDILKVQRWFLGPYRGADGQNRAVSYLAGHRAIRKEAHLLKEGKVDEFIFNTGLIGDAQTLQKKFRRMYRNSSPENFESTVENMAHEYGKHIAEESQYIYNRVNAPKMFQGVWGRAFGQFGLWPISYAEWMIRNTGGPVAGISAVGKTMVGKGSALQRYRTSFITKNIVMRAALMGLGTATGVSLHNWNFANPPAFEGGPPWQLARDVLTLAAGGTEFEERAARSNTMRFLSEFWFPLGGFMHDLQQAADEPDPLLALGLALGFNLDTTKDRMRKRRQ